MKAFYLILLSGLAAFAQNPILEFAGSTTTQNDGIGNRHYYRCNPTFSINQSAAGEGLTWNFNGISSLGEKNYSNADYTTSAYPMPGSTMTTLSTPYNSPIVLERYYSALAETGTSITGYSDDVLTLSYSGSSAFIGLFPMEYQDSNSTEISGDFWYNGSSESYSGIFTGTSVATVDAYGTLNTNLEGSESIPVTRLKIVQDADIAITVGSSVHNGTLVQTMYRYYREEDHWPYMSWARYTISCPTLSINQTITKLEKAFQVLLSDGSFVNTSDFKVVPNPVTDKLFISNPHFEKLTLSIFDMNGRLLMEKEWTESGLDVSQLSPGTYIMKLSDNDQSVIKKFIKN